MLDALMGELHQNSESAADNKCTLLITVARAVILNVPLLQLQLLLAATSKSNHVGGNNSATKVAVPTRTNTVSVKFILPK